MVKKVAVIIHSLWGHVKTLADEVVAGLQESGVEVKLWKVQEILPQEVLTKMHAQNFDLPVITPNDLAEVDGFMLGISTRFGGASASMRAFFDATGGLFANGGLDGKFAGIFTTTSSQHGGVETTALTTLPFFIHQGVVFVPFGYKNGLLGGHEEVHGASPYGAGAVCPSSGAKNVTDLEKKIARAHGAHFGGFLVNRIK
eukprot:jgi/Hompol1/2890/HPOL_006214-RA